MRSVRRTNHLIDKALEAARSLQQGARSRPGPNVRLMMRIRRLAWKTEGMG